MGEGDGEQSLRAAVGAALAQVDERCTCGGIAFDRRRTGQRWIAASSALPIASSVRAAYSRKRDSVALASISVNISCKSPSASSSRRIRSMISASTRNVSIAAPRARYAPCKQVFDIEQAPGSPAVAGDVVTLPRAGGELMTNRASAVALRPITLQRPRSNRQQHLQQAAAEDQSTPHPSPARANADRRR